MTEYPAKNLRRAIGVLVWLFLPALSVHAEVLGVIKAGTSTYIVEGNRQSCCDKITFTSPGEKGAAPIKTQLLKDGEFTADGSISDRDLSGRKLFKRTLKIALENGAYYLPMPGTTFLSNAPRIYYEDGAGKVNKIDLRMSGGRLKGVRISNGGLELFFHDRALSKREKNGRQLFGIARAGRNYLLTVSSAGVVSQEEAKSSAASIFWMEEGDLYTVDEKVPALVKYPRE